MPARFKIGDPVTARVALRNGTRVIERGDGGIVTGIGLDRSLEIDFSGVVVWVRPGIIQPVCLVCGAPLAAAGSTCLVCIEFSCQEPSDAAETA